MTSVGQKRPFLGLPVIYGNSAGSDRLTAWIGQNKERQFEFYGTNFKNKLDIRFSSPCGPYNSLELHFTIVVYTFLPTKINRSNVQPGKKSLFFSS